MKIVDKKNRRRQMGYSLLRGNNNQSSQMASKENELKIKREISILKKCRHPNVVQLLEVIDSEESRKIYMALEYSEYGEIEWRDELDQPILDIFEARSIFRDVVNGLDYCKYRESAKYRNSFIFIQCIIRESFIVILNQPIFYYLKATLQKYLILEYLITMTYWRT